MARNMSNRSADVTVVDGASLFDATEVVSERFARPRVTIDYVRLRGRLDELRSQHGWRPASSSTMILTMDPNSEGQQRFQSMVRHSGFETDLVYYRDAFSSLPPGRSPSTDAPKPTASLAARVAYIAGVMARYQDPHFIVVSHAFELFAPLADLAKRTPMGRVGLAYFGSLLDFRWKPAGLYGPDSRISFFDLDDYSQELLGFDFVEREVRPEETNSGLSKY